LHYKAESGRRNDVDELLLAFAAVGELHVAIDQREERACGCRVGE
jgi:hypothetical protein